MKHWRIIVLASMALLVPLVVFGEILKYENPLGCAINTIPKFIKIMLGIVMKVGMSIGTIFIIWTGFLFLTAQGEEAKITKAKHAFTWTCIGLAVLLGSWLLAVAIEGTIRSIGGPTQSPAPVDGGPCVAGDPTPVKNKFVLPNSVGALCTAKQYFDASANPLLPDPMVEHGLDPNDPLLLKKSLSILETKVRVSNNEQAYVFVNFGGGGGVLLHTNSGGASSVELPSTETIKKYIIEPLLSTPTRISMMHTHPLTFTGVPMDVSPSAPDLEMASLWNDSSLTGITVPIVWYAADANGVWQYSVPKGSEYSSIITNSKTALTKIVEFPELKKYALSTSVCDAPEFIDALNNVSLSSQQKAVVDGWFTELNKLSPFFTQDRALEQAKVNNNTTLMGQILRERLALTRSLGIVVNRVN